MASSKREKDEIDGKDVMDKPVEEVLDKAQEAQIVATVEPYQAAEGAKNLLRLTRAPLRLPPGSEVTFYEKDGVVRYYALTEKPAAPVEAIRKEVEAQKETLAEVATLKTVLTELQGELTRKDQELVALRSQLQAVEAKQAKLEAAPELGKVKDMEAEMKELRTFRDEVKSFMKRAEG